MKFLYLIPAIAPWCCVLAACAGELGDETGGTADDGATATVVQELAASPASAVPVPADYDGNGSTEIAVKGSNGIWYLDIGVPSSALAETACSGNVDDDGDGMINEGCPASGPAETSCEDLYDSDGDGLVNDGCPSMRGHDRYGGRWDAAYLGHGDAIARPVPADYGRSDGGVEIRHRADLAIKVNDASGMWAIDYADNGFNGWDVIRYGYGDASATPVPADYDDDGRADLAVKTTGGQWLIDYAADGFTGWNAPNAGCTSGCAQLPAIYGGATWLPVPGDYNGDGRADLAIKNDQGQWKIDYSNTANTGFGAWNPQLTGYGFGNARPVPFNYDPWRDNKTDLAIKDENNGDWYIDYAFNGFTGWDTPHAGPSTAFSSFPMHGYGGSWAQAALGDYDADGLVDLSVYDTNGFWYIDRGVNGWFGWDVIPGTSSVSIDNPHRVLVDTTRPRIVSTKIYGETISAPFDRGGVEVSQLIVGVRYTVDVVVARGTGTKNWGGVEINNALGVPASLKIAARTGSTYVEDVQRDSQGTLLAEAHRRYAITCNEPGNFPLGFQIRSTPPYSVHLPDGTPSEVVNPDYGIHVRCVAPPLTGVSGQIRERKRDPNHHVFIAGLGNPITNATVTDVATGATAPVNGIGKYQLNVVGGPRMLRFAAPGYADAIVFGLVVPGSGVQVNVQLEREFTALKLAGIHYTMYIDYSRGRTTFHTVKLNRLSSAVRVGKAPGPSATDFHTLRAVGEALGSAVIMNGTWWNLATGNSQGYTYSATAVLTPEVLCDGGALPGCTGSILSYVESAGTTPLYPDGIGPMLTVAGGTGAHQFFDIVGVHHDFTHSPSTEWTQIGPRTIWDESPRDGVSDVSYALEITNPPLTIGTQVIAAGDFVHDSQGSYDYTFARTSVGLAPDGNLFLVVADGDGVHGGQGATANQLAHFYRDVLNAFAAMALDSGLSTQLFLRRDGSLYQVNTIAGEDATIQADPYGQNLDPELWGKVGFFLDARL